MRVDLSKQEILWIVDLIKKDKEENDRLNKLNPHPLYELRRDNMESLEYKIESAILRQFKREEMTR
jgi:hypothetical protein